MMMITTSAKVRRMTNGRWSTSNRFATSSDCNVNLLAVFAIILACSLDSCLGALNNCPINNNNNNERQRTTESLACTWSMPTIRLGNKGYYVGLYFKANWYMSHQYCVFHGMRLASIENHDENLALVKYLNEIGLGRQLLWTSGTDQAKEGSFVWFGNGKPVTFTNWSMGQPDNAGGEHCLELWNPDGQGLKWNDRPCHVENYFVCEIYTPN